MNSSLRSLVTPVLMGSLLLAAPLQAETRSPGYFDLGSFAPPTDGSQFVEVDLKGNLLAMAARIAATQEPEVAEVLRGIEAIRVNVIGLNNSNRAGVAERISALRAGLSSDGWERIVTVQQEKQDVGVFVKTRSADSIVGVVVTVMNGDEQAVFVNVVGDIRPEKIAQLGEHFGIEPLKKAGEAIQKK